MGTVRGKVTYHGAPVTEATVAFLCDGASRMAIGTTDASGVYQLTSYEDNDGAVVGQHVITVIKRAGSHEVPVVEVPEDYEARVKAMDDVMLQSAQQTEAAEHAKPLIPEKYSDRNKTDLKRDVVEGENVIDLELVD